MKLLPLPKPFVGIEGGGSTVSVRIEVPSVGTFMFYTSDQMREYAAATIEEATKELRAELATITRLWEEERNVTDQLEQQIERLKKA